MIRTSASSQTLVLLQNKLPKCLRLLQQIKPLLLLWKFQQTLAKMLAKGKKMKFPRARIRTNIRVKTRFQTPPSLSPSKLLTQGLPRHKLRTLVLVVNLFSLFNVSVFFFFYIKKHVLHSYYQWKYIPFALQVMIISGELLCFHHHHFFSFELYVWLY